MIVKNIIRKKKHFQRNLVITLSNKLKNPFVPFWTTSPILQVNVYATKKSGSVTFIPLPSPNLMKIYQKKLNRQS